MLNDEKPCPSNGSTLIFNLFLFTTCICFPGQQQNTIAYYFIIVTISERFPRISQTILLIVFLLCFRSTILSPIIIHLGNKTIRGYTDGWVFSILLVNFTLKNVRFKKRINWIFTQTVFKLMNPLRWNPLSAFRIMNYYYFWAMQRKGNHLIKKIFKVGQCFWK